jgi:Fur family ferric uptake transcriptional regulator
MAGHAAHLLPEEILARGRAYYPALSRPTVYRTLEALTQLNVVRPVWLGDGRARYAVVDGGHQHLVCTSCGDVTELPDAELRRVDAEIETRFAFRPSGRLLEVFGVCAECQ